MAEAELVNDKALATRSEQQGLATIPDWMENAPEEDQIEGQPRIPRLAIAQGLSPQLQRNNPKYIPELKLGELFNTLTREVYGVGPLEFSVVRRMPSRWIEFDADRKVVDPDVPPNDPRTQWRQTPEGRKPPIATQFLDFIVVLLGQMEPIAISCARTGMRAADDLLGLISIRRPKLIAGKFMRLPEFAMKFTVEVGQATGPANSTYGVFTFKQAGDLTDDLERARLVRGFRDQFVNQVIDIDVDTDAATPEAGGDTSFNPEELERQARVDPGM